MFSWNGTRIPCSIVIFAGKRAGTLFVFSITCLFWSRIYWLDPACQVSSLTSLYEWVEGSLTEFHSLKILCFPRQLEKEIAVRASNGQRLDLLSVSRQNRMGSVCMSA